MNYIDLIQQSIDYIESNLKTDITTDELCKLAEFSKFHFCRLFKRAVGMPIKQYVVRRRLLWAAYEIAAGRKQIDVSLEYGFDTFAGFYKAFVREFGCSPSEFVKRFTAKKPYRINLLQEEHIMITHKNIKEILANWGIQDQSIGNIVAGNGGINENVFSIGDKHILKVSAVESKVHNNIAIATAMKSAGFSAAVPVKTVAGDDHVTNGGLYFTLTERVDGAALRSGDLYGDDRSKRAYHLGEMIGRLHSVLKSNDDIVCNERDIFEEVKVNWLEKAKTAADLSSGFCDDYLKTVDALQGGLPVQIIHRDPNPSNVIVNDGKITGFIDFDISQRSIRIFDPCYAATAILSETFSNGAQALSKWPLIYRNIIRGYDSVAHLTDAEKTALPYVLYSIQLICVGYFSRSEMYQELAKTNIDMLRYILEIKDRLAF